MSGERMTCERFEELLFESIDGVIERSTRTALDRHAGECERCSELRRLADGDLEELVGAPEALLDGIMAATGVDVCGRARAQLIERDPSSLDALDPMLSMHTEGCERCGALHRALLAMRQDLPALVELEPDPDFIGAVMRATVDAPRLADWWQRLLARPRLALEGAYVGTLMLALTFVTPAGAITQLPGRVLQELRAGSEVRRTVSEGWDGVAAMGAQGWAQLTEQFEDYAASAPSLAGARSRVELQLDGWGNELTGRWERLREWLIEPLLERIRALVSALGWPQDGPDDDEARAARLNGGTQDDGNDDDRRAGASA